MRQTIVHFVGAIDAHSVAIAPSSNPLADLWLAKVVPLLVLVQVRVLEVVVLEEASAAFLLGANPLGANPLAGRLWEVSLEEACLEALQQGRLAN